MASPLESPENLGRSAALIFRVSLSPDRCLPIAGSAGDAEGLVPGMLERMGSGGGIENTDLALWSRIGGAASCKSLGLALAALPSFILAPPAAGTSEFLNPRIRSNNCSLTPAISSLISS